jgi:hypothetical protein
MASQSSTHPGEIRPVFLAKIIFGAATGSTLIWSEIEAAAMPQPQPLQAEQSPATL